ncbi:hypothetical protein [Campylobacter showae]|uniref:hypothetical protein n=1 Tax=Campylobacter showae TaxID=204 RepID=UPI00260AC299|nr:hypothetical protein [Campylobacter showae]
MVFLKILTCAFSMSFCFMSIYGLTTSAVELALFTEYNPAGDADPLGDLSDPLDWLQLNIAYLVGFWIFFSSVCAVIYRRLSCFDEISKFFIDLFLPTVATIILALILGAVLPFTVGAQPENAVIAQGLGIFLAEILFIIIIARLIKRERK